MTSKRRGQTTPKAALANARSLSNKELEREWRREVRHTEGYVNRVVVRDRHCRRKDTRRYAASKTRMDAYVRVGRDRGLSFVTRA